MPSETIMPIPREILTRSFSFSFLQHLSVCSILHEMTQLSIPPDKIGILCGSVTGGIRKLSEQFNRLHEKGVHKISPLTVPQTIHNSSSSALAIEHHFKGISGGYHCMETSAMESLCDSIELLKTKEFEAMFIGAGEDIFPVETPMKKLGGMLYLSNLQPEGSFESFTIECVLNRGKPWLTPDENLADIIDTYFNLNENSKVFDNKLERWVYFNYQKADADIFKGLRIELVRYPQFIFYLSMGPLLGLAMAMSQYSEFKLLVISSEGHSVLISCKKKSNKKG